MCCTAYKVFLLMSHLMWAPLLLSEADASPRPASFKKYAQGSFTAGVLSNKFPAPSVRNCATVCKGLLTCPAFTVKKKIPPTTETIISTTGISSTVVYNVDCVFSNGSFSWASTTDGTTLYMANCGTPPEPGQFGFNTWSAVSGATYGQTFVYGCQKGAALHSDDLVALGISSGPSPTDAERFQNITVTCTASGDWSKTPRCSDFVECKKTSKGRDYYGKLSVSASGKPCLPWATQTLDSHPNLKDNIFFPGDGSVAAASNFCRNPLDIEGPFCIVNNASNPREFCNVPGCEDTKPFQCMKMTRGSDYMGDATKTATGITCQAWNVTSPHAPVASIGKTLQDDSLGHNKCRNPDKSDPKPWCYTTDPNVRFAYCNITYCPGYP